MSPPLLLLTLTLTLTLTLLHAAKFGSTCIDSAPAVPARRTGCGVLPFMDQKVFGNNADSRGVAVATPTKHGMRFTLRLKRLSRPNLVLTAWLVYALPGNPRNPPIFNVRTPPSAARTSDARGH